MIYLQSLYESFMERLSLGVVTTDTRKAVPETRYPKFLTDD